MIQPWIKEKAALARYRPSSRSRMRPILSKSMPPVPWTLATRPLNSSVVALPRILGPSTEKRVPAMAKSITTPTAALYFPI